MSKQDREEDPLIKAAQQQALDEEEALLNDPLALARYYAQRARNAAALYSGKQGYEKEVDKFNRIAEEFEKRADNLESGEKESQN